LGYHFGPEGLAIAQKTFYSFVERAIRLYEQELMQLGFGSSSYGGPAGCGPGSMGWYSGKGVSKAIGLMS